VRLADHSSRGVLPSEVCLSVMSKPQQCHRLTRCCCAIEKPCVCSVINDAFTFLSLVRVTVVLVFHTLHRRIIR
jgi:hypothetical protein